MLWIAPLLHAALGSAPSSPTPPAPPPSVLRHIRYILPNGLTLLVQEDHALPLIAVHVWYHVGSKNEQAGKTGFAHLFEHLMFNGSENHDHEYFGPLDRVGADINGGTDPDRTSYHEIVPKGALDLALFLESDRMGHLLGAVTQAKLDEQRGVVENEIRQGTDAPYGRQALFLSEHAYPAGHPYSWTTGGSLEDLDRATLDDVKQWFNRYYGPSNAVVVLVGDIDSTTARRSVERYFGAIPPGPPVTRRTAWVARMTESRRSVFESVVPESRLVRVWNVPGYADDDASYLALLARILGGDGSSRLRKRLVDRAGVATSVLANIQEHEIGSQFYIRVNARSDADLPAIEAAVSDEVRRLVREGPTPTELAVARAGIGAEFARNAESVGGPNGRAEMLAEGYVYAGDATMDEQRLALIQGASLAQLRRAGGEWLGDGSLTLLTRRIEPMRAFTADVDRSRLPDVAGSSAGVASPPAVATLSSGMHIVVSERPGATLTELRMVFPGSDDDPVGEEGAAALSLAMLPEGSTARSADVVRREIALLGGELETRVTPRASVIRASVPSSGFASALGILADLVIRPALSPEALAKVRALQASRIRQEGAGALTLGRRLLPRLLSGGAAGAGPWTGSGDSAGLAALNRDALRSAMAGIIRPDRATLVVVGAVTLDSVRRSSERLFAGWVARGPPPQRIPVQSTATGGLFLVDRPGAEQSMILGAVGLEPRSMDSEAAMQLLERVFGGSAGRLYTNLRETKHWSYGAYAETQQSRGRRALVMWAPVQTDKTTESLLEVVRELRELSGNRPVTAEELADAKGYLTQSVPIRFASAKSMADLITDIVADSLPPDYQRLLQESMGTLSGPELAIAARRLGAAPATWLIIGDRRRVEAGLRSAGLGPVTLLDENGTVLAPP